jgi:hypothetical protein
MPMDSPEIPNDVWQAILNRDRQYDGRFVYGVLTTGIYCRPSCPARRPHRRNTLVFSRTQDAEIEGFIACQRCFPTSKTPVETSIKAALDYIGFVRSRLRTRRLRRRVHLPHQGQGIAQIVSDALKMLENMNHRGGCGCEEDSGDGAGILVRHPDAFFRRECKKEHHQASQGGQYGVGMIFLPQDACSATCASDP